jgi:hypothetical protein
VAIGPKLKEPIMKRAYLQTALCSLICLSLLTVPIARCAAVASRGTGAATKVAKSDALATALPIALDSVDPDHKAILVAGAALSEPARRAAASGGRRLIDLADVPQTAEATFPAGYLRIDSATLSGDEARVRLWKGPIPKAKPGVVLMDCGTGLSFQLKRGSGGIWTISSRGITLC